jgi:hypothetical protein
MRNWEVLIVPLIAFGVWLLGNLFKTADDAKKGKRAEGRNAGDLDRFLAQARKRRELEEQSRRTEPVREAPRRAPQRQPARPSQPLPAPKPASRTRPGTADPQRPVVMELAEEVRAVLVAPPAPLVAEPVTVVPVEPALAAPPPPPASRRPVSPLLAQVVKQLRSPQSAAAAFVFREVFDRPLSQRRR